MNVCGTDIQDYLVSCSLHGVKLKLTLTASIGTEFVSQIKSWNPSHNSKLL